MGLGFAYGKGHGKGKPTKQPKTPPYEPPTPPIPYLPPFEPTPPPIDDGMSKDCFGSSCPPKTTRKRNVLTFRTRGVQGIRRYR